MQLLLQLSALLSIAADDTLEALEAIDIYFFLTTNFVAWHMQRPASSDRDCGRQYYDDWGDHYLSFLGFT